MELIRIIVMCFIFISIFGCKEPGSRDVNKEVDSYFQALRDARCLECEKRDFVDNMSIYESVWYLQTTGRRLIKYDYVCEEDIWRDSLFTRFYYSDNYSRKYIFVHKKCMKIKEKKCECCNGTKWTIIND